MVDWAVGICVGFFACAGVNVGPGHLLSRSGLALLVGPLVGSVVAVIIVGCFRMGFRMLGRVDEDRNAPETAERDEARDEEESDDFDRGLRLFGGIIFSAILILVMGFAVVLLVLSGVRG